jgi:hypothetical protein
VLIKDTLKFYDYLQEVEEAEVEEILDLSVMSADEQHKRRLWTLPLCERPSVVICKISPHYHENLKAEIERQEVKENKQLQHKLKMDMMVSGRLEMDTHTWDETEENEQVFDLEFADDPLLETEHEYKESEKIEASSCLPVAIYDVNVFVETLVELLMELDKERFA